MGESAPLASTFGFILPADIYFTLNRYPYIYGHMDVYTHVF